MLASWRTAAVLLMCVALSGCLFGGGTKTDFQLKFDEELDQLYVMTTGPRLWSNITAEVASCSHQKAAAGVGRIGKAGPDYVNESATTTGGILNQRSRDSEGCGQPNPVPIAGSPMAVTVGEYLSFCSSPHDADLRDVRLILRETDGGKVLFDKTFKDWRDC